MHPSFPLLHPVPPATAAALLWQGLAFSGAALLFVAVSAWWLYFSPLRAPLRQPVLPTARQAAWSAGLLGLAVFQMSAGGLWDASMHILTGEVPGGSDFLWPPHIMIYSAFAISLLVAAWALRAIALPAWREGVYDPRQWVRRSPYIGAVALASLYALLSIPGDALWHELFGIDLTAWSPPHLLIMAAMAAVILSAVALLVRVRDQFARPDRVDLAVLLLLGLMLNAVYIAGVLEWELPGRTRVVEARPIWLYPLVGGGLAFFVLLLAKRLVRHRWAATGVAVVFFGVRFAITLGLGLTANVMPAMPLVFILGALLMDVIRVERIPTQLLRNLAPAAAFTAGFVLVALPLSALRTDLAAFTDLDYLLAVVTTLAASVALIPLTQLAQLRLVGERAQRRFPTP